MVVEFGVIVVSGHHDAVQFVYACCINVISNEGTCTGVRVNSMPVAQPEVVYTAARGHAFGPVDDLTAWKRCDPVAEGGTVQTQVPAEASFRTRSPLMSNSMPSLYMDPTFSQRSSRPLVIGSGTENSRLSDLRWKYSTVPLRRLPNNANSTPTSKLVLLSQTRSEDN